MMSWIAIRNFEIEKTERGFVVLRYESQTQEFESLGERADLKDAVLLMLDAVIKEVENDNLGIVDFPCPRLFEDKRLAAQNQNKRRMQAKLTMTIRAK